MITSATWSCSVHHASITTGQTVRERPPHDDQLSEAQVTRILHLAARLQESQSHSEAGVTLADVERAAAEAGIDSKYVRAASLLLDDSDDWPGLNAVLGASPLFLLPTNWGQREFTLNWSDAARIDWGTIVLFGTGIIFGTLLGKVRIWGCLSQRLAFCSISSAPECWRLGTGY